MGFSNDFISSGSKFVWLLSADSLKPVNAEQFVIGYQHFFTNYDLNIEYYYSRIKDCWFNGKRMLGRFRISASVVTIVVKVNKAIHLCKMRESWEN